MPSVALERVPEEIINIQRVAVRATANVWHSEHLPHPEAEMRALPVPNGSSLYSGWYKHPKDFNTKIAPRHSVLAALGEPLSLSLRVTCFQDQWSGEWSVSGAGCEIPFYVELIDESHLVIRNVVGLYHTELHASVTSWGVLHGEAVQDGIRGGSFRLWPMTASEKVQLPGSSCGLMTMFAPKVPKRGLALRDYDAESTPEECSICLERFLAGDWLKRTSCSELGVGHVFHQQCLDTWLEEHHTCPVCRHPLREPDLSKDQALEPDRDLMMMARVSVGLVIFLISDAVNRRATCARS